MRFTHLEITNYRQYKSLKFEFPKRGDKDLHVIIGQNGMGKTNILNAITWCLYGKEPHLGLESKSLPKLNLESKKEAELANIDTVDVEVKIFTEDNGDLISYQRRLPINIKSDFEQRESFFVTTVDKDNNTKMYEHEDALRYVNKYMPEKIREYFYFDNEQLHNYFLEEQNSKIKESVHTISQVEMLSRISDRLGKVINKKNSEAGSKAPDIEKINLDIYRINQKIASNESDMKQIKNQIEISEKIIYENTEKLRGQDNLPELEERYQLIRSKISSKELDKKNVYNDLLKFLRDMKICLSFYPHAKKTLEIIQQKEDNNQLPPNIDKQLLEKMLNEHKCLLCNRDLNDKEELEIKNLLNSFQVSTEASHLLMRIRSELEYVVDKSEKYLEIKEKVLKNVKSADCELQELESELQKLDNEISRFTDKRMVLHLHEERLNHEKLLKINTKKLGAIESEYDSLVKNKEQLDNKLTDALSKQSECARIYELIKYSKEAKKIVELIEFDMMNEVKDNIQKKTFDYFDRLIWKKNTYQKIALDDNYYLDLIHKDGYSCVGSCSAAERALLALSFTLALHEVSGFNSLLFIDTPVARVSDQNRINFAEVLNDVSKSKQIIMTFAPDEYSDEIRKVFEPSASTQVQLSTNNERYTYI